MQIIICIADFFHATIKRNDLMIMVGILIIILSLRTIATTLLHLI